MSQEEAIVLLQKTEGVVELIIARGGISNNKDRVSLQESVNSLTHSDISANQVCV